MGVCYWEVQVASLMLCVLIWLVVEPTPFKNIGQTGNLPQVGVKNKKYLKPPPSYPIWDTTIFAEPLYQYVVKRCKKHTFTEWLMRRT